MAQLIGKAAKYLSLIVLSSIVGAHLGTGVGMAVAAMTGEPAWVAHGRCAGWTLLVLVAAVGAPSGFVRYCGDAVKRRRARRKPPATPAEGQRAEGGVKALIIAPLVGGFAGLILGGMAACCLVALYFFVALSPLGPGGWWPILPLSFRSTGDGFSSNDSFIVIPILVVVGTFVLLGAILGLIGTVTWGEKRYQVFGSRKD